MIRQVLSGGVKSSSEDDSYSMIFASLKHSIRRKILRALSSEAQTFSDLQKQFNIESSHLVDVNIMTIRICERRPFKKLRLLLPTLPIDKEAKRVV
jgi:hypothetical protein